MQKQIMEYRYAALSVLLKELEMTNVLILNPGMGNIDMWLEVNASLPTPAPFNRNSAYIFSTEGPLTRLCQTTTHPTDRAQYPHFEDTDLSGVFQGKVGIVNPQCLKKNVRDHLTEAYPDFSFMDITDRFYALKAVKSQEEINQIREACMRYDRLFTAMPLLLRPERLEKEVVNEIRQRAAWQGADSETPGFHSMVTLTSAPDGAAAAQEPLSWPGRRLQMGDRINVVLNGYQDNGFSAALGRSFLLGTPSKESVRCWDLAVKAQALAASMLKPGMTLRQIGEAVDQFLGEKGFPAQSSVWIHGIGTAAYEYPRNTDHSIDWPLEEGMVLAVGPELRPGDQDPLRCVDVFVVTGSGGLQLSKAPQQLTQLF